MYSEGRRLSNGSPDLPGITERIYEFTSIADVVLPWYMNTSCCLLNQDRLAYLRSGLCVHDPINAASWVLESQSLHIYRCERSADEADLESPRSSAVQRMDRPARMVDAFIRVAMHAFS